MWQMQRQRVEDEITNREFKRLVQLRNWLYPDEKSELEFRVAPSLVTRSEAELFGVSMPRFAFRAYLTPKSFVNARRIETFGELATSWGQAPADYYQLTDPVAAKKEPKWTIQRSSCIGDSLLEPPVRLLARYHVLTTKLGRAYGECQEIDGTPFVNHIRLGGGWCAQAVCLMATALCQDIARGIYGVAEITALAGEQDHCSLGLCGMNAENICSYFNHPEVGLSAALQGFFHGEPELPIRIWQYGQSVRAYIESGVPVIALVDLGRMCGVEITKQSQIIKQNKHIFVSNGLDSVLDTVAVCRMKPEPKTRNHAVLVVGCKAPGQNDALKPTTFLINDPSTYPFLKATAEELVHVRSYDDVEWKQGKLGCVRFISVTPQEVRLPLMNVSKTLHGLVNIALAIQSDPNLPGFASPIDPKTEVRLVDLRWCEDEAAMDPRFDNHLAHLEEPAKTLLKQLVREGMVPAKWTWLQCGPSQLPQGSEVPSVWIWDATVPPADKTIQVDELKKKYLLAVLVKGDAGWTRYYVSPPQLAPALISSFYTREFPAVRKEWPNEPVAVDLYAFMHPEVDRWLNSQEHQGRQGHRKKQGIDHPLTVMAEFAGNRPAIEGWAKDVCRYFSPKEIPIVSMTSFVPEVTSSQRESYEKACKALQFLVEFAMALKCEGHSRLRTIEIVAGSRIAGIWPARNGGYMATKTDDEEARRHLLSALGRAISPYADLLEKDRLSLAIELEPGPMYLLRNWQSLVDLCRELDRDPLLSRFVGVNLDIAHWVLARDILPDRVWDTPEVRNRIVHAHIAGHHRCGHLGDLPLGDLNRPEEFRPWIDLLRRIAADWRPAELPQFSGYVSLELEAAKDREMVIGSLGQLGRLLMRGNW